MTRGYVVIRDGKKIENVAYLSSDAYLSWYGIRILNAVFQGTDNIRDYVAVMRKDNIASYGKDDDPCDGFKLNWMIPDKESRSYGKSWNYSEYGYIYSVRNRNLKVYLYGKFLFSIFPDEYEKYKLIFEDYDKILNVMRYDPSIFGDKGNWINGWTKCLRDASRMPIDRIMEYIELSDKKERVYLSDEHLIAPGYTPDHESYIKILSSSDINREILTFVVSRDIGITKNWEVYLQTPFLRVKIAHGPKTNGTYSSEKAAVDGIRNFIKNIGVEKLFRTAEIYAKYEIASEKKDIEKLKAFSENIKAEWDKEPWFVPNYGYCSVEYFTDKVRSRIASIEEESEAAS